MEKTNLQKDISRPPVNRSSNGGRRGLQFLAVSFAALAWLAFGTVLPNASTSSRAESLLVSLLDTTFGAGGIVVTDFSSSTNDRGNAVALQTDGKIVVAGVGSGGANTPWNIARYNTDGSLDTTFGTSGKLGLPLGGYASGVFLQPDGKIIVTGTSAPGGFTAVRLNATGALDTTFDTDGIAAASFGTYTHAGNAGILQPDGKIVVAGHLIGSDPNNIEDWAAARFNADGSLDTSFDTDGKTVINIGNSDEAFGAELQADGKIVIAGFSAATDSTGNLALVRLNANGSLDPTFDADGKLISPFPNNFATSVAIQTDGKIIAAGSRFTGNVDDFTAERYNTDGSLDTTFGTGGRVITVISSQADRANDVVLQPDGKFILSGVAVVNSVRQFALARYNADGSLDPTFSTDGIEITQIGQISQIAQSIVQPDGKIVAVGNTRAVTTETENFALARYLPSGAGDPTPTPTTPTPTTPTPNTPTPTPTPPGTLDPIFDGDGKTTTNFNVDAGFGSVDVSYAVAVQPDGKLIAAGQTQRNTTGTQLINFALARYNQNGSLDSTFGSGGKIITSVGTGNSDVRAVAVQTDGKIVAAGNALAAANEGAFAVVRYNADGSLDSSFGTSGIVINDLSTSFGNDRVYAMQIQPDGKILVAGSAGTTGAAGTDFAILRYNPNGTLDGSFGNAGIVLTNFTSGASSSFIDRAAAIALQTDGKIVAAGVDGLNGIEFALARYNPNGSLDTTFGTGGKVSRNLSTDSDEAFAVTIQRDGKIVAAGRVVTGSGQEDFALIRFNANGTSDTTFNTNGSVITSVGAVDAANAVLAQPDGKIVAVGLANTTTTKFALIRYNANGTRDTTFGTNGIITTGFGSADNGSAYAAILQNDGKIVAAGSSFTGEAAAGTDFALARYYAFTPRKTEFDFDGDGRADTSVFRPSSGVWYLNRSAQGFYAAQFGTSSDKLAPADYDGDGKTDIAVWRENSGNPDLSYFYILQSSNNTARFEQFGRTGDDPRVVGDWDADGKADLAVYRPSTNFFFYRPSSQPTTNFVPVQWGASGDVAVRGDFDGDGKFDAAVFRPSTGVWYIRQSTNNQSLAVQFGVATDKTVSGDFDADGKTDIAVFRPSSGVWYIRQSSDSQIRAAQYGLSTDKLVHADYDADGKTDIAVWRGGIYYVLPSTTSQSAAQQFGAPGDAPVAAAFVP